MTHSTWSKLYKLHHPWRHREAQEHRLWPRSRRDIGGALRSESVPFRDTVGAEVLRGSDGRAPPHDTDEPTLHQWGGSSTRKRRGSRVDDPSRSVITGTSNRLSLSSVSALGSPGLAVRVAAVAPSVPTSGGTK